MLVPYIGNLWVRKVYFNVHRRCNSLPGDAKSFKCWFEGLAISSPRDSGKSLNASTLYPLEQACCAMASKLGSRIWVRTSYCDHPVDSVAKLLVKHPYNRKLQILLPLPHDAVQAISTAILSGFYYIVQISLSTFVDCDFIQANLVNASLFCASADTSIRVAITPDGYLHIVVCKQQYECLGLAGERVLGTGKLWFSQVNPQ